MGITVSHCMLSRDELCKTRVNYTKSYTEQDQRAAFH